VETRDPQRPPLARGTFGAPHDTETAHLGVSPSSSTWNITPHYGACLKVLNKVMCTLHSPYAHSRLMVFMREKFIT